MTTERLQPGISKKALRRWAERRGLLQWLDRPAALIGGDSWSPAQQWVRHYGQKKTLGDAVSMLTSTAHYGSPSRVQPDAQQQAILLLESLAATIASGRAEASAPRPPLEGALALVRQRLERARDTLIAQGLPPMPTSASHGAALTLYDPPLTLAITLRGQTWCQDAQVRSPVLRVQLEEDDPEAVLRCSCSRGFQGRCPAGMAALARALHTLERDDVPLIQRMLDQAPWQRALDRVETVTQAEDDVEGREAGWRLTAEPGAPLSLEPALMRPLKTRAGMRFWNAKLESFQDGSAPGLRPVDRRVAQRLLATRAWPDPYGYSSRDRDEDPVLFEALALLNGHPKVFLGRKGQRRLDIRVTPAELRWRDSGDGGVTVELEIGGAVSDPTRIEGARSCGGRLVMIDDQAGACRITEFSPGAAELIAALIGASPFPPEAADALLSRLGEIAQTIPVSLDDSLRGEPVRADDWPIVQLQQEDNAVTVAVRVEPLPGAALQLPGQGPEVFYGADGDKRIYATRDLAEERAQLQADLDELGQPQIPPDGPYHWTLSEPEQVLALLEGLEEHDDLFTVSWIGPPAHLTRPATAADLRVDVGMQKDWFGLSGSLDVDGVSVPLLELFAAAREGRSVIRVGSGAWVRLTESFREQLNAASGAIFERKDGRMEVSPLNVQAVAELAEHGATVDAPPQWIAALDRIREAAALKLPTPEGLSATLRPYQQVGWEWLARLTHWSPGACLADDMGLGKTIQGLALLLHRVDQGPALVVAPTSVGFNWQQETERFAPGLRARLYRNRDRKALLEGLTPGDVLITSYDLMARDREALEAVHFGTVLFDEAQAVKNANTKRARAARALDADVRVALTGTPVENRTSELWSLLNTVTPGLLGSWERFRKRFAAPIERDNDEAARAALARLIQPFILRRTKAEVAPELPPRLEICEKVELSRQERAIYERSRLAAVARLAGAAGPPEQRRFQVLAAITRLRQLACNPRLVEPESTAPSAKLERLLELVDGLRTEGHRALIFSQFTRHLGLVREALEAAGVSMRYLDGSTPAARRQAEVEAFQAGAGEVFLISLKAGGTGLNLTGANYVIHLDPWWNPSVEDQATDRAHRIGQTRAVTVYRLIAQGTIEEAILEMHAEKRALVEGLLEGTGRAAALSTEELLAMLA